MEDETIVIEALLHVIAKQIGEPLQVNDIRLDGFVIKGGQGEYLSLWKGQYYYLYCDASGTSSPVIEVKTDSYDEIVFLLGMLAKAEYFNQF